MNWRVKAFIQRALGALPPSLGDPIYHGLQMLGRLQPDGDDTAAFLRRAEDILQKAGKPGLSGRKVVELGSGWHPVLPFLLLEAGVREVITVDLNRHYCARRIREAARAVLGQSRPGETRLMLQQASVSGRLPARIAYYPRTALQNLPPELLKGTDLALSRFVLEHVEPEDLVQIHATSHRWMAPEGLWIHAVSPSDHRAFSDSNLHIVDFLRYSAREWSRLAGNRYAYHNRLRLPHYRELFARCEWRVVMEESKFSPACIDALARVPLSDEFRRMQPEDLVAGSLWFILERVCRSSLSMTTADA